jgi:PDDEXK-like domain of unknown function (DUF3799)
MSTQIAKMTMPEYIAHKAISSGLCHRILAQSPLHAWIDSPWNPAREQDNSAVADIGTIAHACLLEGGTNALAVIDPEDYHAKNGNIPDGWTNKAIRGARDTARAEGKIPILVEQFEGVHMMVIAAKTYLASSELAGILDDGEPEVTMLFDMNGLACKARADFLATDRRICLSYKTTLGSAKPDAWIRTQLPGYDAATLFYERAVCIAYGVDSCLAVHLVQEQHPPYSCSLVALSPAWRELAAAKLDSALETWRRCVENDAWPAYPTRIAYAEPRAWQINEAEEMQVNTAFSEVELEGGIPL